MPPGDLKSGVHLVLVSRPGSPQPSDVALVSAYADGQPHAGEQIWQKYAPLVDRVMARFFGRGQEIEDLTQEVFLRVFSRIHTLEDPSALRSFIYSIAIRVLRWELRRRWIRRCLSLSAGGRLPERAAPCGDFEARQAVARLYGILDRLAIADRAAFVLRQMEGLSLEETSQSLGVSVATVKRRVRRACETIDHYVRSDGALLGYLQSQPQEALADAGP